MKKLLNIIVFTLAMPTSNLLAEIPVNRKVNIISAALNVQEALIQVILDRLMISKTIFRYPNQTAKAVKISLVDGKFKFYDGWMWRENPTQATEIPVIENLSNVIWRLEYDREFRLALAKEYHAYWPNADDTVEIICEQYSGSGQYIYVRGKNGGETDGGYNITESVVSAGDKTFSIAILSISQTH